MLSLVLASDLSVVVLVCFSFFFCLELCLNLDINVSHVYLVENFKGFFLFLLIFYSPLLLDLKS